MVYAQKINAQKNKKQTNKQLAYMFGIFGDLYKNVNKLLSLG